MRGENAFLGIEREAAGTRSRRQSDPVIGDGSVLPALHERSDVDQNELVELADREGVSAGGRDTKRRRIAVGERALGPCLVELIDVEAAVGYQRIDVQTQCRLVNGSSGGYGAQIELEVRVISAGLHHQQDRAAVVRASKVMRGIRVGVGAGGRGLRQECGRQKKNEGGQGNTRTFHVGILSAQCADNLNLGLESSGQSAR
jgi:hypothetical protein